MMSGATALLGMGNLLNNCFFGLSSTFFYFSSYRNSSKPLLKIYFDRASGSGSGLRKKKMWPPIKKGKIKFKFFSRAFSLKGWILKSSKVFFTSIGCYLKDLLRWLIIFKGYFFFSWEKMPYKAFLQMFKYNFFLIKLQFLESRYPRENEGGPPTVMSR